METHEEYDNLFQDEDMMDYGADTKYISSPLSVPMAQDERVLAKYDKGDWRVEAQVVVDGEWYVASRDVLNHPPDNGAEWRWNGGRVQSNYGAFTGLSTVQRIIMSPLYAIWFTWLCVKGEDVNLQILEMEE